MYVPLNCVKGRCKLQRLKKLGCGILFLVKLSFIVLELNGTIKLQSDALGTL